MQNIKKYIVFILIVILAVSSVAGRKKYALSHDEIKVYQNISADQILNTLYVNKTSAKNMYDKQYLSILGEVSSISKDYKKIEIKKILSDGNTVITCKTNVASVISDIKTLKVGDHVYAYGQVEYFYGDININKMTGVRKTFDEKVESHSYSLVDGTEYDVGTMTKKILVNDLNHIEYYIPQTWDVVEKRIDNTKLVGYQYELNTIQNEKAINPESLFIFYFKNEKMLKNNSDAANKKGIEAAIVNNILKLNKDKIGGIDFNNTTYYGAVYDYFEDSYAVKDLQSYHTEFVFQQVGTDGFLVYLYVYEDKNHINDILTVMRLAEVNK